MHEDYRGVFAQSMSAYRISPFHSARQDQLDQGARESSDHQSASGSCGKPTAAATWTSKTGHGKLALCTAHVEEVSYPRKEANSSTRRTMTHFLFSVTSSKRASSMLNMELPKGNACTIKLKRCCRKLANQWVAQR